MIANRHTSLSDMALFGGANVRFVLELQNYFFWKMVLKIEKGNKTNFVTLYLIMSAYFEIEIVQRGVRFIHIIE
jgi:hypothetical protein